MKLSTFSFEPGSRWSVGDFPALDSEQTLVIVFAAPEYMDHPAALAELANAYPKSSLIGCSTAGEIAGPFINDGSLSVAVLQFERSSIVVASAEISKFSDSLAAGEQLARQLKRDDLCSVFILSDGLHVNGSELVKGFNSVLPPDVVVTGGLAGDGDRFQRTWVIRDGKPETGVITATGFYGDSLQITHGSRGGWDRFGPERRVTRSQGNILYELDGRPALALYKDYLGERASGLPATALLFPLSIRQEATDSRQLVRTVLAVDEASQSMTFAGDIPKGYIAQLMRANFDRLCHGASQAADQARDHMAIAGPVLAVAISCVGRRLVLGERTEEETEITLDNLPEGAEQIGFYSYGEISPCIKSAAAAGEVLLGDSSGPCEFHNQTMTLTTFSEV
jgi:hypothetical protein